MVYKILKLLIVLTFFIPVILWLNELLDINVAQVEKYVEKSANVVTQNIDARYQKIQNSISSSSSTNSKGIDVSHFNGKVQWKDIHGEDFVIIKSTGGDTYIDPMFKSNWHGARTVGLKRGAYHFYYASDDPISQSKNFLDTIGTLKEFDLPAIVDVEILDHADKQLLLYGLTHFLDIIEKKTKKTPIIYSGLDFYKSYLMDDKLRKYPIWLADYAKSDIKELRKEIPDRDIVMWQYTQSGKISGIDGNVDRSFFYGDLDAFIQKSNIK